MRWILITGATSGIGRACARRLAEAGFGVIACGRNARALESLRSEAVRDDLLMVPLSLDVTASAQIANAVQRTKLITSGRGIDVLINNAGYGQTGFLLELSRDQVRRQFEVNLFSILELTRALLPQLERNRGTVINMGSIISRFAAPWVGLYGTVKNALRVLTEVMRVELLGSGIRVVLVEPGATRTAFFDTAIAQQGTADGGRGPATRADTLAARYARARAGLAQSGYRPFRFLPAVTPNRVADLVLKIVRFPTPRRRYVVPPGAGLMLGLLRLLPRALLDRFSRRAFYLA